MNDEKYIVDVCKAYL